MGFSGGADSQCLLHLLVKNGYSAVAAHFNHHLRLEAEPEAESARVFAGNLGCEFLLGTADVNKYAEDNRLSLEEAARILRYSFLFAEAERTGASAVAVAHQADDQVETMLMHLLRGSGSSGLKAMSFRSSDPLGMSKIPLIRPLLGMWREEVEKYCRKNLLNPAVDQSNFDVKFYRNRIRLELIPELESYNPQVKKHLWQTAFLLGEENAVLEQKAEEIQQKLILEQGNGWIIADLQLLKESPPVFQRKAIRDIIFKLRNSIRDVDFEMVTRVMEFLGKPKRGQTLQLANGVDLLASNESQGLFLIRTCRCLDLWPLLTSGNESRLEPDQIYEINDHWQLETSLQSIADGQVRTDDRWSAALDYEKLMPPLTLSTRRVGDWFEPFGLKGRTLKLGDFWTNEHLPVRAREFWPLIRSAGKIVWLPGFRIAEFCRVTEETRQVLWLSIKKKM